MAQASNPVLGYKVQDAYKSFTTFTHSSKDSFDKNWFLQLSFSSRPEHFFFPQWEEEMAT